MRSIVFGRNVVLIVLPVLGSLSCGPALGERASPVPSGKLDRGTRPQDQAEPPAVAASSPPVQDVVFRRSGLPTGPLLRVDLPRPNLGASHSDRLKLQVALAKWAKSQPFGYELLPLDEINRVAARAVRGELLSNGEACALPAPADNALLYTYPKAAVLSSGAGHESGGPVLVVDIKELSADGSVAAQVYYATVPVPQDATVEQLVAALDKLQMTRAPGRISVLGNEVGSRAQGERQDVSIQFAAFVGDWGKASPDPSVLEPDGRALDHCFFDGARQGAWNELRLEVSTEGEVAQCEAWDTWQPPMPGQDCVCAALSKVLLGKGAAGRTVFVSARHRAPRVQAANKQYVHAEIRKARSQDPSVLWAAPEVPTLAVDTCFESVSVSGEMAFPVRWSLDEKAHVQSLEVEWGNKLAASTRTCVEGALLHARFTCPQAGAATRVDSELVVTGTRE